jgi:hypothetical protein
MMGGKLFLPWNCFGAPAPVPGAGASLMSWVTCFFEMKNHHLVGGYAFQPTWADGHGSGLYSFDYLRLLGSRNVTK